LKRHKVLAWDGGTVEVVEAENERDAAEILRGVRSGAIDGRASHADMRESVRRGELGRSHPTGPTRRLTIRRKRRR